MKKWLLALGTIIVVLIIVFFVVQNKKDWTIYENSRYEFSVEYPSEWSLGEAPTNNDGREFISPDESVTCRAYGFANSLLGEWGEPQTLKEFIDWLSDNSGYGEESLKVVKRGSSKMAGVEAEEVITSTDEVTTRAVYILNEEEGRGLACYYPDKDVMEKEERNFVHMQNSFKDKGGKVNFNNESCVSLVGGAITPLKDYRIFHDAEYTEVTLTSREEWDKDRLPKDILNLEGDGYSCYPMPAEFNYSENEEGVSAQPEVMGVEWTCELEYDNWEYLEKNDFEKREELEDVGFDCVKEQCLDDSSNDSEVWLCTK